MISSDKAQAVREYAEQEGRTAAREYFGISPETLRRYIRQAKQEIDEREWRDDNLQEIGQGEPPAFDAPTDRILRDIASRYTHDELKKIAAGGKHHNPQHAPITADWFRGETMRFGVITDTHIGSKYFREDWFDGAVDRFHEYGVDFVMHVGDITEGMSNRPGQIYELDHLGYTAQRDVAVEQMRKIERTVYVIDGNHDRWFAKSNGAYVVPDICDRVDDMHFIGHDMGVLTIGGIDIMMWHGEDGSSYAHSYRLQKVIEALPGGSKPNILLAGHVHKMGYFFIRNIHAVSAGCLQEQTAWMRGKRLEAHTGFWIIECDVNDGSIVRFSPNFFPYY